VILGGCLEIAYVGASASCLITSSATAKTLSSAIGVLGAEAPDATFGVAGTIDLTLTAVDTLTKLAAVIDAYANYTCTVLYGEDISPQNVISGIQQTHLTGALKAHVLFNTAAVPGNHCTHVDVSSEMQNIPAFTSTTKPTDTEVTNWCTDTTADIDAVLASIGITLPVTDADKLTILRVLAVWGVCARVLRSLEMQSDAAEMYQKLYDNKIKQITANPSIIASLTATFSYPAGPAPAVPEVERKFRREEQDW
jgi:hypothetical protein